MELTQVFVIALTVNGMFCYPEQLTEYQDDMENYQADYYNDSEYSYDESRENSLNGHNVEKIQRRNPKFVTTKKMMMINAGGTIKLPCEVDRLEDFILIWKKGGEIISLGDKILQIEDKRFQIESTENGNSLIISLAAVSDAGEYTCQVNSPDARTLVHTVQIRVAPVVSVTSSKLEVKAGQSAVLSCTTVQGNPAPELYWTRQMKKFRNGGEKLTGDKLELNRVSRLDSGFYTCHGDNGWGEPANSTTFLEVLHAPEIEQQETFIHTKEGAEVEVTCTVHAAPLATVEWYMNGQLLEPETSVISKQGNRHTLYITGIGNKHTHGKYMCRAVNALGEASKVTEVSGRAKPAQMTSSLVGSEPDRFTLTWETQSNTKIDKFKVEYREKDEDKWIQVFSSPTEPTPQTFQGSVLLENLTPGTEYTGRVESMNMYGWSDHNTQFKFSTKPMPRDSLKPKYEPSISEKSSASSNTVFCLGALTSFYLIQIL